MDVASSSTKRSSLRFHVQGYSVRFKTEFEDGTAKLDNISKGGCALYDLSYKVSLYEKVLLVLEFDEGETVETSGNVVRVVDNYAALKFTQISEEAKQKIVVFFAKLQRQLIST